MNIAQSKTMTNTPMTSREEFEKFMSDKGLGFDYLGDGLYGQYSVQLASEAWQACEQQNQSVIAESDARALKLACDINNQAIKLGEAEKTIAELRCQLANIVVTDNTPVIAQQAQTIADLNAKLEWWRELFPSITPKAAVEYQTVYDKTDKAEALNAELVEALDEAILGLSNGLWDYGTGQDEHEQCDILLEKLRAISDKVKGK